jgi:hypothetical protein
MKRIFLIVVLIAFITGCATIVSKSKYPVNITSNPENIEFTVVNKAGTEVYSGKTPDVVKLDAGAGFMTGENYIVTFTLSDGSEKKATIQRGVDNWYIFGNIFIGGLLGWIIIDPATGAMWELDDLHAELGDAGNASNTVKIQVLTYDSLPEHLKERLVRIN